MAYKNKEEEQKWHKDYYNKNKTTILAKRKEYNKTHSPDRSEYIKRYNEEHRDEIREKKKCYYQENKIAIHLRYLEKKDHIKETDKERRNYYRNKFLEMYGGKCNCPGCVENNPSFLTLDHVKNDGYKNKKGKRRSGNSKDYKRAVEKHDPETYQILCFNCNMGKKNNNGVCPHIAQKYK